MGFSWIRKKYETILGVLPVYLQVPKSEIFTMHTFS